MNAKEVKRDYSPRQNAPKFDFTVVDNRASTKTLVDNRGHNGSGTHSRGVTIPRDMRAFIAWDGEGTSGGGRHNQRYSLFGNSEGDKLIARDLTTLECLQLIIASGKANPGAFHIGFAFDYDVNMILRDLSVKQFKELNEKGSIIWHGYRIEHVSSKWLQVTEYNEWRRFGVKGKSTTVRINDIFGFFQCSFVKACKSYLSPDHPEMVALAKVEEGKARRNEFTFEEIDYVEQYWTVEIALLRALIQRLKEMLDSVDLKINRWHGPGAIANHVYKARGIKEHKAENHDRIIEASRFAYAGGRFELFRLGRHEKVYGIDINSAYPAAISQLPSLAEGYWRHVDSPSELQEFGVYHVRMVRDGGYARNPSPLFHRDSKHNIAYPWTTEGWYWSPEVRVAKPFWGADFEIVEGWEYVDWETRPFQFVARMYDERRRLKAMGNGAEKALKLALNSLYGKMAQRVGWERTGRAPVWHQLEWAGYVTSATRAKLYAVMLRIPWENLIAVETDGIYTTAIPRELGIRDSAMLGKWETSYYDEMMYVQSGVYFGRQGDTWTSKYRGLDNGTLTHESIRTYLQSLHAKPTGNKPWLPIVGPTTRFIGYRNALQREAMNQGPMKVHHTKWETTQRELSTGAQGKRRHLPSECAACQAGANAYEMPHDLVISSKSRVGVMSEMHSIPWADKDTGNTAEWRQRDDWEKGLIIDG